MWNDDEYTSDERAAGAIGALILLAILGGCGNLPYKNPEQVKEPKQPTPKIEHYQRLTPCQVYMLQHKQNA